MSQKANVTCVYMQKQRYIDVFYKAKTSYEAEWEITSKVLNSKTQD